MKIKNSILLFFVLLLVGACIDRLEFDTGELNQGILVVDGNITDQPGPYTIKLTRSSDVDAPINFAPPFDAKEVIIADDAGNSEKLTSRGAGEYLTSPNGIRGTVGRKYHIRIELNDGTIFESTPDEMKAGGSLDSVYFQFESFKPISAPTQYGFRVFADAEGPPDAGTYQRWRYTGTYKVLTYPEKHRYNSICPPSPALPDPPDCSGYVYTGTLVKNVKPCTCCLCWVNDNESKPHLSESEILTDGTYKKIELGYVPFNEWTFSFNKYMIKVEQMSLTRDSFEFWKTFQDQKEGLTSLFQPSFGKARTNIHSINSNREVLGLFYASSIRSKIIFITSKDSRLSVPPMDIQPPDSNCGLWNACDLVFYHASRTPPPEWE